MMRNQLFNRKLLFSLLAVVMCLGFTAMSYGQAVVSVEPAEVESPAAGEELMVSINIAGGADVAGYQLTVNFDPTALSYVAGGNADYLPAGAFAVPVVTTDNSVTIAATSLTGAAADADGTLATVTFEILEAKASAISLSAVTLADATASALEVTTADGMVTVAGAEEPAAEEAPAEETAEEPAAEEAPAEETAEKPAAEEAPAEEVPTAVPVPPEPEPIVPGFDVMLDPGLNMVSVPLMPAEPYTAKSLAEMLGATVVIKLNAATQSFVGYTVADGGDGFAIDGGKGYIVNTPAGGMVKFTGDAWDNQPEPEPVVEEPAVEEEVAEEPAVEEEAVEEVVEEPAVEEEAVEEVAEEPAVEEEAAEEPAADAGDAAAEEPVVAEAAPAAPALSTFRSAWAFIVTSDIQGMDTGRAYTLVAENLRTGSIATQHITTGVKRSSAVWADLNRKSVVEAGDKLQIALYDDRGRVVSGPFQRTVATTDLRNAFLSVDLRVGDVRPQATVLAQNFPNPFNPETWIPYQLSEGTEVSIQIYDVSGRLVRSLDLGWQPVGSYMMPSSAAYWDGRNAVGERVASGIYFYTLQTSDFAATRRMVILK